MQHSRKCQKPIPRVFFEALYDQDKQVFGRSNHGIKLHSAAHDVPSFDKDLVDTSRSVWSIIGPFAEISSGLRQELDDFSRYAIYAPQTAIMRGLAVDNRVVEPLGLTGAGLASAFKDIQRAGFANFDRILRIIWEPGWSSAVQVGAFDSEIVPGHIRSEGQLLYFKDRFMQAKRNSLSAYDASEGTLYLLFVAILLAHPETSETFALDNVDGTLNPSLVRKLTDHVVEVATNDETCRRQVFMTSHHPSSLDSFDIFDKKQRIFVCSRHQGDVKGKAAQDSDRVQGSTSIYQMKPPSGVRKENWVISKKGKSLSQLLLSERIPGAL